MGAFGNIRFGTTTAEFLTGKITDLKVQGSIMTGTLIEDGQDARPIALRWTSAETFTSEVLPHNYTGPTGEWTAVWVGPHNTSTVFNKAKFRRRTKNVRAPNALEFAKGEGLGRWDDYDDTISFTGDHSSILFTGSARLVSDPTDPLAGRRPTGSAKGLLQDPARAARTPRLLGNHWESCLTI